MKSITKFALLAIIIALGIGVTSAEASNNGGQKPDGGKGGGKDGGSKIAMCHDGETILVNEKRVQAHLDQGDVIIEPGVCCSAQPTKPSPDAPYTLYQWDWRICDWVITKYCPPDEPAPDGMRCEWCVKSCSWSCVAIDGRWWGWQAKDCVWFTFGKESLGSDNTDENYQMMNYPNPFSSEEGTNFEYFVKFEGNVRLTVSNSMGQMVKILVDQPLSEGSHSIYWNGKDENGNSVESGVYLYQLITNGQTFSKIMVITN